MEAGRYEDQERAAVALPWTKAQQNSIGPCLDRTLLRRIRDVTAESHESTKATKAHGMSLRYLTELVGTQKPLTPNPS